ncbi:MAG: WbqC family protein [Candidatus Omnitrophica bacterium]|nr:WbqC family protein [Candidatus Omnitrophota bacterium]
MIVSVHQPQYLPWLGYFDKIAQSDCFVFLDQVQYKHREFQNRNKIRSQDGWMWLTLPIIVKEKRQQRICDCRIDSTRAWQRRHLNSIRSCYGKAPFFKEFEDFFEGTYCRSWERFVDLTVHGITFFLKSLSISTPIYFESELGITTSSTARIIDICKKVGATAYLSGAGGREYLQEELFAQAGIQLRYQQFSHPCYHQQFCTREDDFIPYMSIVDLLCNEGTLSKEILKI